MVVAAIGILVNGTTAELFMAGRKHDLNLRAAFQHMVADALVALGVVIAGGAIRLTGWLWLDPVVSLLIGAVILVSTWGMLREAVNLALDAVPRGIDARQVQDYLLHLKDVNAVHDLHIWPMSTTETALTAHLVLERAPIDNAMIERATEELHSTFGIEHVTLQREIGSRACDCHPCEPVAP
jgi:cobalt-zinc-cadmium efflux system protein